MRNHTVTALPTAIAGANSYVSNESGGGTVAFSNGIRWRMRDSALVS